MRPRCSGSLRRDRSVDCKAGELNNYAPLSLILFDINDGVPAPLFAGALAITGRPGNPFAGRKTMRTRHVVLWLISLVGAAVAGTCGGWLLGWVTGSTVTAHVDRCYKYYGMTEISHVRCEGYWTPRQLDGLPVAVRGPLIGAPVNADAKLADPRTLHDLGYELAIGNDDTYLATLRGDAAIVVPRPYLLLGPAGLLTVVGCAAASVVSSRRGTEAVNRHDNAGRPAA